MPPAPPPDQLRSYLLGRLDESRARSLEEAYVLDEEVLAGVGDAEQDLIADYLAGRLDAHERVQFDTHYLASPVHRARVETARALQSRLDAHASAPVVSIDTGRRRSSAGSRWRGVLLAAAAVLMGAALIWFAARQQTASVQQAQRPGAPPAGSIPTPTAPAPSSPDRLADAPGPGSSAPPAATPGSGPSPAPAPRPLLAITLAPGVTRSDRQRATRLPAAGTDLLLHLEGTPEASDTQYVVEIETVDGVVVWKGRAQRAAEGSGRLASVRVPSSALPSDDYVVIVAAPPEGERERYVLRLLPQ